MEAWAPEPDRGRRTLAKPSYPGVYVEEVPSGVRTIKGVSTSTAVFVGWTPRGPADVPVRCQNWADYERVYGSLDGRGLLPYAVQLFFINGGTECFVLRLTGPDDKPATAVLDGLEMRAKGPGTWSHAYQLVATPQADDPERFRLDIVDKVTTAIVESHADMALGATDGRSAEKWVNEESQLLEVTKTDESKPVTAKTVALAGGEDGDAIAPGDPEFDAALFGDGTATGIHALKKIDLFNLLNVPGYTNAPRLAELAKLCRGERAFLLVDSDKGTEPGGPKLTGGPDPRLTADDGINAAYYYPWIMIPDPKQAGHPRAFPPGGAVAGLFARTDSTRGVWKAPAGIEARLRGAINTTVPTTDGENNLLNPLAVNCIRVFPHGVVVWGARTLRGSDQTGSDWKYVPVRRTALFIEESLYRGLKWVVFEPNDEPLWAQIRLNVGSFMQSLFRQGAFQGTSPREAYFVKCDRETTTQNDVDLNIVNIVVGFAPLKPAEFVILKIRQMAGQQAA